MWKVACNTIWSSTFPKPNERERIKRFFNAPYYAKVRAAWRKTGGKESAVNIVRWSVTKIKNDVRKNVLYWKIIKRKNNNCIHWVQCWWDEDVEAIYLIFIYTYRCITAVLNPRSKWLEESNIFFQPSWGGRCQLQAEILISHASCCYTVEISIKVFQCLWTATTVFGGWIFQFLCFCK